MEKLWPPGLGREMGPAQKTLSKCRAAEMPRNDPSFRRIVTFHYHPRMGNSFGFAQMDSNSRVFESSLDLTPVGVPLRCPRPMTAQPVVVWTPARVLGALFSLI